jgi:DNA-binding response OmpR family regulator
VETSDRNSLPNVPLNRDGRDGDSNDNQRNFLPAVLILYSATATTPPIHVGVPLTSAGYVTCSLTYELTPEQLCHAFPQQMPDLIVADLSRAYDSFPLRRLQTVMKDAWGENLVRPPLIALITRYHYQDPDLRLLVDDFLLPPYDPEELRHRIVHALFRHKFVEQGDTLIFAGIRLYLSLGRATTPDGKDLDLTRREFELLRFLMTHRGRGFTRTQLLSQVWGMDYEGGERTVDIHIRRLRAKLPEETAARLDTRRGYGYGFRTGE